MKRIIIRVRPSGVTIHNSLADRHLRFDRPRKIVYTEGFVYLLYHNSIDILMVEITAEEWERPLSLV